MNSATDDPILPPPEIQSETQQSADIDIPPPSPTASGPAAPTMAAFAYDTAAVAQRESALLNGDGLPLIRGLARRQHVVVICESTTAVAQLKRIKRYLKEVKPTVIAVGTGAEVARSRGISVDLLVLGDQTPSAKAIKGSKAIVVTGTHADPSGRAQRIETSLDPIAVALLLANATGPAVVAGVGIPSGLGAHVDARSTGTFLARLVGSARIVDADAVANLYDGRVRPRHVLLALVVATVAVIAAIATTDIGQEWWHEGWIRQAIDWVQEQVQ